MRRRRRNRFIDEEELKRKKRVREMVSFAAEVLLVILAAYLIITYGVEKTTMIGESMIPTLENEDRIIVNKMAYRFTEPGRFDIIVFKQSGKEHSYYMMKRVVGLPGETVQIKDGAVWIDGKKIKEKVSVDACVNGGMAEEPLTLEAGEYFVLGDNRNNSEDSRFANVGTIQKADIIGKAWIRLEPFDFVNMIQSSSKKRAHDRQKKGTG